MRLSSELALPEDFAARRAAIVAKSGGGKTYTAAVVAEEFVAVEQPFYALDPTGAWWGLRSSATGKSAGLPVIVIGGEHGDVPLDEHAGAAIADLVVGEPNFYVIDVSGFGARAAEIRFATAFLDRLFRAKAKDKRALHGFWDEADLFAPQRVQPNEAKLVGAAEQIIRRGRIRGLGTTLITQRPATVNKNVLTQIDVLIALQIVGPQDRKAIKEYLDGVADPETRDEVLGSLASLGLGEAWVYAPGVTPPLYQRTTVRERRTFNSSATGGSHDAEPARLAPVDLDALRERLEATIEKAKDEDPEHLRARIRELEREVDDLRAAPAPPERIEVPILTPGNSLETVLLPVLERIPALVGEATDEIRALLGRVDAAAAAQASAPRRPTPKAPASSNGACRSTPQAVTRQSPATAGSGDLTPARQRILDALAWFGAIGIPAPRRAALAPLAGTKPTSGGFKNNLGALRSSGLIDYPVAQRVELTDAGAAVAHGPTTTPSVAELQTAVLDVVPPARAALLEQLIAVYPRSLTREDLAERVDVPPTSGGFKNNLGALRTLEFIDYPSPGVVAAEPLLFGEDR